jgi:N-methylhydantoinase A
MRPRIGVDVGGTFTDVVMYDEDDGHLATTKVLTSSHTPGKVMSEAFDSLGVEAETLGMFIHATTLVTNLILERKGARVGLLTTRGFRDVLEIGLSYREEGYNLQRPKAAPLVPRPLRRELSERVSGEGQVLVPLDAGEVEREVLALKQAGVEAIAVCFMHSYANPAHEYAVREIVASVWPDVEVSLSSDVDPQVREYERTSTTVLNAYSMPAVASYISKLSAEVHTPPAASFYMHSGGGVVPAQRIRARPIDLVASGPGAGVMAALFLGEKLGLRDLVTFDVGGTSSDVCLIEDSRIRERDSIEVEWGIPMRVRCIDVISVGAGGGSIAWVDAGNALKIGPRSAGAHPGPVCYGLGGSEPTVTDANLVLGILDPDRFLGGRIHLDREAAVKSMAPIAAHFGIDAERVSQGIRRIATVSMAQAVRTITVQKGIDPRKFTLVAFGGAGGQHALDVAAEMEMPRVMLPPFASTLSALGLMTADLRATERTAFLRPLQDERGDSTAVFENLRSKALVSLGDVDRAGDVVEERFCSMRYLGQSHELTVPIPSGGWQGMQEDFEDLHERLYGTRLGDPIETVALGITLTRVLPKIVLPEWSPEPGEADIGSVSLVGVGDVPAYWRPSLAVGQRIAGPCLVYEVDSTVAVRGGWSGTVGRYGELLCAAD